MKKRYRIDKSVLAIGTKPKVEDAQYLKSYKCETCEASRNGIDLCGLPCVGAHIRTGEHAGMRTKPSDDLTIGLCTLCHEDQEKWIGAEWFLENVLKPQRRRRYREWKNARIH